VRLLRAVSDLLGTVFGPDRSGAVAAGHAGFSFETVPGSGVVLVVIRGERGQLLHSGPKDAGELKRALAAGLEACAFALPLPKPGSGSASRSEEN
jgi:hypothetical protein